MPLGARELAKYHALGNAYLVLDGERFGVGLDAARIRALCDPARGVGSDGVLVLAPAGEDAARLAIFNPDGSRAERSGNGLRICARALIELGYTDSPRPRILTDSGAAVAEVTAGAAAADWQVVVDMGAAHFAAGEPAELAELALAAGPVRCTALSVGNPHCVVWDQPLTAAHLARLGPEIERHPAFARRTNVQLARVRGRDAVELLIWERGAGATPSSGSSACAVVAAAWRRGLVDRQVAAHMPGGVLHVSVAADGTLRLAGPVTAVLRGHFVGA